MGEIRPICIQKNMPKVTYLKRHSTLPWAALQSALYDKCAKRGLGVYEKRPVKRDVFQTNHSLGAALQSALYDTMCEKRFMCVWKKVYVCMKRDLSRRPTKMTSQRDVFQTHHSLGAALHSALYNTMCAKRSRCVWKETYVRMKRGLCVYEKRSMCVWKEVDVYMKRDLSRRPTKKTSQRDVFQTHHYGVASVSRFDKIIGLLCKRAL